MNLSWISWNYFPKTFFLEISWSALVERVVTVLPHMKCPYALEPHQIQGLDFINIFPVIQWLVKESVNLRNLKAERLKLFAIGQFHNHFKLTSSDQARIERNEVLKFVKRIENLYAVKRQFKRKQNLEPEDERSRVRLTLLEYGIRNITRSIARSTEQKSDDNEQQNLPDEMDQDEVWNLKWFSCCFRCCMVFSLFAWNSSDWCWAAFEWKSCCC